MDKHYYIVDRSQPRGFVEVTEAEFLTLAGDAAVRPYAWDVYRGEISLDDVPEDLREAAAAVVAARTERFGAWSERELTDREALNIIVGGAEE